jgi:hypothetical protein
MKWFLGAVLATMFVLGLGGRAKTADDKDVNAILDKAIKALGGEDKLTNIEAASWKGKGKMIVGDNQEHEFASQTTVQGFDRFRSELEVEAVFGRQLRMLTVLNGDKVWLSVGGMAIMPDHALAALKRSAYMNLIPATVVALKAPGFKLLAAGEEQVEGEPAFVIKVTCPDGSDMAISFNKNSGRPVKVAGKVFALDGRENMQETIYGNYKDFGGILVATKQEVKIDGKPYRKQELTEFKILDKVESSTFSGPAETAGPEPEASTVPGPESDKLLPATTGNVLFAFGAEQPEEMPSGDIVALQLPGLKSTVVRPRPAVNRNDMPTIHAVSGPDAEGRIAYIEDHFFVADEKNRRHLLKTVRIDGTHDTELFSRPGDAMWAQRGEIGSDLALSPVGGRVAFESGLVNTQMPGTLLQTGTVEIWDVEKKARTKASFKALEGLAWLPDGKRLAYVKLIDTKELPAATAPPQADPFTGAFKGWRKLPAVFVRDVDAETEVFLHVGWHPVVSSDGQAVLVSNSGGDWRSVDVATGKSDSAAWPGMWAPVALANRDVALSLCLPTKGTKIRFTRHNSALSGPKEMLSLKLAKVNANEFQTVLANIDPRTRISFGRVGQAKGVQPR